MPATIGPLFALQVTAPREWNGAALLDEHEVAVRDTQGRGWVLEVFSAALRERLLAGGEEWVFIAQVLREDAESFYAFAAPMERALFMELRELDGVGPKTAAGILNKVPLSVLRALAEGESAKGLKVPGLGPKSLEKLGHGLQERRERFALLLASAGAPAKVENKTQPLAAAPVALLQALTKLGLRPQEAERLFGQLLEDDARFAGLDSSEQLRRLLQKWGQQRAPSLPRREGEA